MKIDQSQVRLASRNQHIKTESSYERLRMWVGGRATVEDGEGASAQDAMDQVRISVASLQRQALLELGRQSQELAPLGEDLEEITEGIDPADELLGLTAKQKVAVLLIEKLTGHKVLLGLHDINQSREEGAEGGQLLGQPQRAGWGVEYDRRVETYEKQETHFSAQGVVRTADGREIAFESELSMSRERTSVEQFSFRAGDAELIDPLVLNYHGNAAELTGDKIDFDLDADGSSERISFVRTGSGFLVLDRNGDGAVTDGSELFGPTTGDGFAELAELDLDGNGWIDEADSAFNDLRLWERAADGSETLATLRERNVGAIHTGRVATSFELQDEQGEAQGQLRSTGVYLTEEGQANTVQQVDLKA